MKVLLIEADEATARSLADVFRRQGFSHDHTPLGIDGVDIATSRVYIYDIIVVGSSPRNVTNIEVLKVIREAMVSTPIILILEKHGKVIEALNLGADDCMVLPINVHELAARIRAVTRRPREYKGFPIDLGRLKINRIDKLIEVDGHNIHLTKIEFTLLEVLALRFGRLVTNEVLMQYTSGPETLKVHIFRLRRKLGEGFISTVFARGHILNRLEKV